MSLVAFSVTPGGTLPALPLEDGIAEDYIDCSSTVGLNFHILESGLDERNPRPLVLLLHGFPELAYSWRKVMPAIAHAGFHCVAPDLRGYGRTTGWQQASYDDTNLHEYSLLSYTADVIALVRALGYRKVHCLVGHDAGSAIAANCALLRPDMFSSLVLMSHPFKHIAELPTFRPRQYAEDDGPSKVVRDPDIETSLANLNPPRKPYKWYNASPQAADDWENPRQGMAPFLRGYFHLKSAAFHENKPFALKSWTADELAKMPHYYVMPLYCSMPETIDMDMEHEDPAATTSWLTDQDLEVYSAEWARTGFQAALNFYRVATDPFMANELLFLSGAKITVPCIFLSGEQDWGNFQEPNALQNMSHTCEQFYGVTSVSRAGHWPQQEQPGRVASVLTAFMWKTQRQQPKTPKSLKTTSTGQPPSQGPSTTADQPALRSAPLRTTHSYTSVRSTPQRIPIPNADTAPPRLNSAPIQASHPGHYSSTSTENEARRVERTDTPFYPPTSRAIHPAEELGSMSIRDADTPIVGTMPFGRTDPGRVRRDFDGRRRATTASNSNDEVYRDVLSKVQEDLNK